MNNWDKQIYNFAGAVISSIDPVNTFLSNRDIVIKYKPIVLLFDGKQIEKKNNTFFEEYINDTYQIKPIANYQNLGVLNPSIFSSDFQSLKIASFVNLDSNIVSLLPKYFEKKNKQDFADLSDLIEYIINMELNISSIPYFLEDSLNSSGMKNDEKVYKSTLYYCVLRRLSSGISTTDRFPISNDYIDADEIFRLMKSTRRNEIDFEKRAKTLYCFLLKMYILKFSSKKNAPYKTEQLLDFCNNELGIYLESGLYIAFLYFEGKNNAVKNFFQKVTPSAKDILKKIEGMSWDLFHIWNIPTEMAICSNDDIIQLQSIASGDKALIDMISVNPIERIFMYNDEAIVKYRYSLVSLPETKYLCEKICLNREKRLSINKSVNFDVLSKSLEQALLDLFKCY